MKRIISVGNKFFPFRIAYFQKGDKTFNRVASLEIVVVFNKVNSLFRAYAVFRSYMFLPNDTSFSNIIGEL